MADAGDLKSLDRKVVWVRVPPWLIAPKTPFLTSKAGFFAFKTMPEFTAFESAEVR